MADSVTDREKEPDSEQLVTHGNPRPQFDWPPPVQLAAAFATALAAVLFLAGYEQAALAVLLLALILQGISLFQLRAFRDEYVRQYRERVAAARRG